MAMVGLLWSVRARAHIELDSPEPEFNNGQNKTCPCGNGDTRDGTVHSFAAGDTITVQWRETIGHTGRMRIAFDADGNDQADFDANVLWEEPDPTGSIGNIGAGNRWEATFDLPAVGCTNCTLQLIQAMNGVTDEPVGAASCQSTYFQCLNIELAEGEGEGEPADDDSEKGNNDAEGGCNSVAVSAPVGLALCALLAPARRRQSRAQVNRNL
jgi:hypothetical protein